MAYSDMQKAMALEIVARNKGVLDAFAMQSIRETLGVPDLKDQNVRYWMKTQKVLTTQKTESKPGATDKASEPLSVREAVAQKLDEKLEAAAHLFVDHAVKPDTLEKLGGQQAMTSAAIAIDKMRLLRDLPTEIIGAAPELTELANFFREEGIEMSSAIRKWRERLQAKKASTKAGQAAVSNE